MNVLLGTKTGMQQLITYIAMQLAGAIPASADPDPSPGLKASAALDLFLMSRERIDAPLNRPIPKIRDHRSYLSG